MANLQDQVIIHPNHERPGAVCSTTVADVGHPIEVLAQLLVPEGDPFLIVDRADLPADDGFWFNAWEADFSEPDGYVINNEEWHDTYKLEDPDNE